MTDIVDIGVFVCAWTLCGAVACALQTWLLGSYFDDNEEYRVLVTLLGPVGLATQLVTCIGYGYFFILRTTMEKSVHGWNFFFNRFCL